MQKIMIGFEGISGAGKTTQSRLLHELLSPHACLVPELNTFSPLKETIQEWKEKIQKHGQVYFDLGDIAKLATARSETQRNVLQKVNSPYVITDRSVYTSAIYESGAIAVEEILEINRLTGAKFPDKVFVLDCRVQIALARIDKRRQEVGDYSFRSIHETESELEKRRQLYLELVKSQKSMILIDSTKDPLEVFAEVQKHVY